MPCHRASGPSDEKIRFITSNVCQIRCPLPSCTAPGPADVAASARPVSCKGPPAYSKSGNFLRAQQCLPGMLISSRRSTCCRTDGFSDALWGHVERMRMADMGPNKGQTGRHSCVALWSAPNGFDISRIFLRRDPIAKSDHETTVWVLYRRNCLLPSTACLFLAVTTS